MDGLQKNILVVDDDHEIVRAIALNLENEGYSVFKAYDGMEALDIALTKEIHLIVIDVMMPKMDGLSAIMKIREKKNLPIIVLSAKGENSDKVIGLSVGADDYITKPFDFGVMLARIEAQLRQARSAKTLTRGSLMLDMVTGRAYLNGEDMQLTKKEFAVLRILVESGGKAFTKESLYETVWGQPMNNNDTALKTSISRLRKKLEADGFSITASRSEGYRFE